FNGRILHRVHINFQFRISLIFPGLTGYVTVVEKSMKSLFFYFVLSSKYPAVLWLNNGPNCSSFDGFAYRHAFCIARPAATMETFPSWPMSFKRTPRVKLGEWKALLRPPLGNMQRFAI
ncbi:hypothetical protein MKW98_021176, partial [Papaver atlanticum]